jgi:hypothetical protein
VLVSHRDGTSHPIPKDYPSRSQTNIPDFEEAYAKTHDLTVNAIRNLLISNGIDEGREAQ